MDGLEEANVARDGAKFGHLGDEVVGADAEEGVVEEGVEADVDELGPAGDGVGERLRFNNQ